MDDVYDLVVIGAGPADRSSRKFAYQALRVHTAALFTRLRGRAILGSSYPASWISSPLSGWRIADRPARAPNPKLYILWC